jgi:hypothetical protein
MSRRNLIYHTSYGEFEGASADEVVQLLYEYSRQGTGVDFEKWWRYQKNVWKLRYGLDVPEDPRSENASQKMLDVMVKSGALVPGPTPPGGWRFPVKTEKPAAQGGQRETGRNVSALKRLLNFFHLPL